jgi:hypothetical protein
MDLLSRIKRLAIRGKLIWTSQAVTQMAHSGITREEVIESLMLSLLLQNRPSVVIERQRRKKSTS